MTKNKKIVLRSAAIVSLLLGVFIVVGTSYIVFANHSAATNDNICGNNDNVRYRNCAEKEAYDNCGVEHQGAIWMSQAQDFTHDQGIVIDTVGSRVTLYLQGSVYTCKTAKSGDKAVYACNITFVNGDQAKFPNWDRSDHKNLYRGTSTSSKYTFFEPASTHNGLAASVDVSSIAPGATDTFSVGINRVYGWGGCSGSETSGSYQTTTIKVKITRKNEWKVTPTTTRDRATVKPTQRITWTHTVQANGGNPPSVQYGYTSSNAGSSNKTAWTDNIGAAGSRVKTSFYDVPAGTAEGTVICRNTVVNPSEGSGGTINVGEAASANSCVTVEGMAGSVCQAVSLAGMTLTKPGSYNAAIQLSNVPVLPTFSYRIYNLDAPAPVYTTVIPPELQITGLSPNQKLSTRVDYTPVTPGVYKMEWQVTGSIDAYCPATVTVGYQPYFSVIGGDILGGFDSASSIIASWNSDSAVGNYVGAGTTLAAIAGGKDITSFVTSSPSIGEPSRLAFANTSTSPPVYGGHFTATPDEPDYYGGASGATQDCSVLPLTSNLQSGLYTCSGDLTLSAGALSAGKNVTVRTTGNVFIAGNITYGAHDLTNIPRLNIYARGNIVVWSQVDTIHGVLVAQSTDTGGGKFYSCGSSAINPFGYDNNVAECMDKPLTIYGSVVADDIILGRTKGAWTDAVPAPAEKFVYSPETWLSKPASSATGKPKPKFDSYISLPPVL